MYSFSMPKSGADDREAFVQQYLELAQMVYREYGIPVSVILAQSMHESNFGNSDLAKNAFNFFGMKCKLEGEQGYYKLDDEPQESCFRIYANVRASFMDYGNRLATHRIYAPVQELRDAQVTDYRVWVKTIAQCGYARSPEGYVQAITSLIEKNKLYRFDTVAETPTETDDFASEFHNAVEAYIAQSQAVALPKPSIVKEESTMYEVTPEPQSTHIPDVGADQDLSVRIFSTPASMQPLKIHLPRWHVKGISIR